MEFKKLFIFALIIFGLSSLASCKKEDKTDKNLWSAGGVWNITNYHIKQVSTNQSDNFEENYINCGQFTFRKDGTGGYSMVLDGDADSGNFTYVHVEDKLNIINGNNGKSLDMVWTKNDLTLSGIDRFVSNGDSVTYQETLMLKRK